MAVRHDGSIPDHDREAISEALEAALLCAAFQRMEESEMKQLYKEINQSGKYPEAPAGVRRRLQRRRGWAGFRRRLPRIAQTAAAFIAVLSIGAGIALAASSQARQWAAGVLQSRVTDPDGWFGEVRSSLTDGVALDEKLLVVEDNTGISIYEGTDAAPVTYTWRDAGNRAIAALAVGDGDIYALYASWQGEPGSPFDTGNRPEGYGLGRVALGEDGAFDVAELAAAPMTALFDPEGRELESWGIEGCVLSEGSLVFSVTYGLKSEAEQGFSFAPEHVRLFGWRLSDGTLTEYDLGDVRFDWTPELFGIDGSVYLVAPDDGEEATRILRVEDGGVAEACRVPYSGTNRPDSFALRRDDMALVYVLDGSVYVAPGLDPSGAVRAALCGDITGRGLMLDDRTYAVVHGESVDVFDLSLPLGEVNELVVDGVSVNTAVNEAFRAEHPDVAIVSDPDQTMADIGNYADLMLSGNGRGDVVALDQEDFAKVRDAGLIAPLTDPDLVAEWRKLPEGLRKFLSVDGRPAAIPLSFYVYPDVMFITENWAAVGGGHKDYPDTWRDYAEWLRGFSHSRAAGEYFIEFDEFERIDLDTPRQFEMYTLWTMAEAFARCWTALGEAVDFDRAEFTDCVEVLADVDWGAMRYGDGYDYDNGRDRRAQMFLSTYDPLFSENDYTAGLRTLRIREDAPRLSRISGDFAFVPAKSTSRATAQAYLKALAAVNRTRPDGSLCEAAGYDFATDPEALAAGAGDLYTADSIRRYREQVGEVAFRAEPDRETILAVRDIMVQYASGRIDRQMLCGALNAVYR